MRSSVRILWWWVLVLVTGSALAAGTDFVLKDVTTGEEHRLSDYRGKWVAVNYWATWCPPCLEEIPELVHFHEQHRDDDAVVLGINLESLPQERLAKFIENNFITYPVAGNGSEAQMLGGVRGLPTTYLVSPEGAVVKRLVGRVTSDELEKAIAGHSSAPQ